MHINLRATLVMVLAVGAPLAQVHAQTATSLGGQPNGRTFVRTPDGDWTTVIRGSEARPARNFVFVPPTKVEPLVAADVTLDASAPQPTVRYRYRIANGRGAKQALARLFIGTGQVVAVNHIPEGWRYMEPQRVGNVSLAGPLRGPVLAGLAPGESTYVELAGPVLPGVVMVRAAGATAGAVEVPEGLTEQQHQELSDLSRQATVDVPAIGPAIASGVGEPELGFDVFLSRVRLHYVSALRRFGHPKAAAFTRLLDQVAVEGAAVSDPGVQAGLREIQQLASGPEANAFHQQLSSALAFCAKALLTGDFPVH